MDTPQYNTPIVEQKIESFPHFQQLMDVSFLTGHTWQPLFVFRGQVNANWPLRSSLHRAMIRTDGASWNEGYACQTEDFACQYFRMNFLSLLSNDVAINVNDPLSCWAVMQHFGAPTRLLDWTASPFVAAYFAAIDNWKDDGAVWMLNRLVMREAFDYQARQFFQQAQQVQNAPAEIPPPLLVNFLGSYFPTSMQLLTQAHHSPRMSAQQGLFTLSNRIMVDYDQVIQQMVRSNPDPSKKNTTALVKYLIPATLKPEIVHRLQGMNITAASLFPGLDGLGRSIRERIMLDGPTQELRTRQSAAAQQAGTSSITVSPNGWAPMTANNSTSPNVVDEKAEETETKKGRITDKGAAKRRRTGNTAGRKRNTKS